jgi:25S rRNA (adenine2142-N1)-methyltransferase
MTPPKSKKRKHKKPILPLAPPPHSQSRKKARQVTTLFHKYTRQREHAVSNGQDTAAIDAAIEEMGGRREYQRASQVSTAFHSTSKWVLGCLAQNGWLHGIVVDEPTDSVQSCDQSNNANSRRKRQRRLTRLLEVGAINTELLDAAAATKESSNSEKKYRLHVRAIDLHSMHRFIEEADFLTLPVNRNLDERYDVIVCSMVLNCVAMPADRGEMMARLYHFLRPGGKVFLTIPKTCLNLSPFCHKQRFEQMLQAVGLEVEEQSKDTPKVAFFICKRPHSNTYPTEDFDPKWTKKTVIRRGKKYRNEFAVTLTSDSVTGKTLAYTDDD